MKQNILILIVLFLFTSMVGTVLVFRPSIDKLFGLHIVDVGIVRLSLFSTYPFFIYFFYRLLKNPLLTIFEKKWMNIIFIFGLVINFLNYFLKFVDVKYYPNYVYSHFHIYLPFLNQFALLQAIVVALFIFEKYNRRINSTLSKNKVNVFSPYVLFGSIVFVIFTQNLYKYPDLLATEVKNQVLIKKSKLQFNDIMTDISRFSEQAVFVRDNTLSGSVVLHPPQTWDFPELGNQVLIRYYLTSRILVSPSKSALFFSDNNNKPCDLYSVLAVNKDKGSYFPNYDIASQTVVFQRESGIVDTLKNVGFDQDFFKKYSDIKIGVIKHKICGI